MSSTKIPFFDPNIRNGLLISIFASISFGLYPAAAKAAYAEGANSVFVIIATTAVRAAALILFCLLSQKQLRPNSAQAKAAVIGGVCQAVSIFGIIGSLAYIAAPITIILMFTHTIMLLLLMSCLGELALNFAVLSTTVLALFGVSLVVDLWTESNNLNLTGVALALLAAVATMIRLYVFGREVRLYNPAIIGAQVFIVAAVATSLLALIAEVNLPSSAAGYFWLGACCLSLVAGTFGMFYGIALLGSFQWSLMAKLEPVFTALFAFLVLDETLKLTQYAGIFLVLASLVTYQYLAGENPNVSDRKMRAKRSS